MNDPSPRISDLIIHGGLGAIQKEPRPCIKLCRQSLYENLSTFVASKEDTLSKITMDVVRDRYVV